MHVREIIEELKQQPQGDVVLVSKNEEAFGSSRVIAVKHGNESQMGHYTGITFIIVECGDEVASVQSHFYEWAKKKFLEMKSIDVPDRTAMSMVKGIMETDESEGVKLARIEAVIRALEDTV